MIGVTFFDVTTLEIFIGEFEDDELMTALRTLTCQIRPVEVIHERDYAASDVIKMLKTSESAPVLTPIPANKCYSYVKTLTLLERYFGEDSGSWPQPLQQMKHAEKDLAMNALGMTIAFLEDALIDE